MLLALTVFFATESCVTAKASSSAPPDVEALPIPLEAVVSQVKWVDLPAEGGLLLAYPEYRKLEANILEYRREIRELRNLVAFYQGRH